MTRKTSLVLEDRLADFVSAQVKSGRYATDSEVLKAGLRLLEEEESRIAALREAIREGVESGPATDWDFDEFMREMNSEHGR